MPQYHPANTNLTGKVTLTPYPKWRMYLKWMPYFVGDRVMFHLEIEKPGRKNILYEKFGDSVYEKYELLSGKVMRGSIIPRECDVEYIIGFEDASAEGFNAKNSFVIMTTHVTNKDRWALGCAGLVVGTVATFIVTVAAAIVSGAFEIDKFWHFINPFWSK